MHGTTIFYYFRRLRWRAADAMSLRHDINVQHCLNSQRHDTAIVAVAPSGSGVAMFAQCDDARQTTGPTSLETATTNQIQSSFLFTVCR